MKAIVLAAGRGERMRPLTDRTPKPLLPVAGRPLIEHHLLKLARCGIREVVINLSWLGEQIRSVLGSGERLGLSIAYSEEGPVPLETGGGIFQALPLLGPGAFLVYNGDVWSDFQPTSLVPLAAGSLGRLVLVPNPPHHPQGDFALRNGRLAPAGERWTYAGIAVLDPELFAGCEPGRFPLLPLLQRAIAAERLEGLLHRGEWLDVGSPERLAALEARLRGDAGPSRALR